MGQRVKTGDVMEIYLDGWYFYAQQLPWGITRFIDFKAKDKIEDFSSLPLEKYMFDIPVYKDVLTSGVWRVVARGLDLPCNIPRYMCIHIESYNPSLWQLYNLETGEITDSTEDVCRDLERVVIHVQHSVEERIRNFVSNQ